MVPLTSCLAVTSGQNPTPRSLEKCKPIPASPRRWRGCRQEARETSEGKSDGKAPLKSCQCLYDDSSETVLRGKENRGGALIVRLWCVGGKCATSVSGSFSNTLGCSLLCTSTVKFAGCGPCRGRRDGGMRAEEQADRGCWQLRVPGLEKGGLSGIERPRTSN